MIFQADARPVVAQEKPGGGNGLDARVTEMRLMYPTPQYPNGYVSYGVAQKPSATQLNPGPQGVEPYSGQSIPKTDPSWHIPI